MKNHSPIARLEAIRILLTFAYNHGIQLQQMDVKSAFLNGYIKEDVYVEQPPSFECIDLPNHVYKLDKALYGLNRHEEPGMTDLVLIFKVWVTQEVMLI